MSGLSCLKAIMHVACKESRLLYIFVPRSITAEVFLITSKMTVYVCKSQNVLFSQN